MRRARIFLAEDDADMRRLVADALRKAGYGVVEAPDGNQLTRTLAQARVEGHSPEQAVDLIVTDVRMPGGDGLDVIEVLRATDWHTPVIVMTAFGDAETRMRAARLQAHCLDKPFQMETLLQTVRMLLP